MYIFVYSLGAAEVIAIISNAAIMRIIVVDSRELQLMCRI